MKDISEPRRRRVCSPFDDSPRHFKVCSTTALPPFPTAHLHITYGVKHDGSLHPSALHLLPHLQQQRQQQHTPCAHLYASRDL
jgi:hypothetical protein